MSYLKFDKEDAICVDEKDGVYCQPHPGCPQSLQKALPASAGQGNLFIKYLVLLKEFSTLVQLISDITVLTVQCILLISLIFIHVYQCSRLCDWFQCTSACHTAARACHSFQQIAI